MDYVLPEKRAIIEFEEYPGLEVTVRISPVPMGAYFEIVRKLDTLDGDPYAIADVAQAFAPIGLIGWNLPEPATAEGLASQPFELAFGIVLQWTKAVGSVPLPLPRKSSAGEPSVEISPSD